MPAATRKQPQDGAKAEINPEQVQSAQFALAPFLGEKQRALLRRGMCASLSDDQSEYFFEVVELTQLNPFEGQIWPSLRNTKDEQGNRHPQMFVLIKIQGFRAIGDRSTLCDGEDPIEWCGEDGMWKQEWLPKEYPVAARARVYRKDRTRPQVAVVRWDAYCQFVFDRGGQAIPNAIWKRMGSHMLGKCALAGAYRGAFPRQASGVYLSEELGGGADTESEAEIEAEMTRKYVASKEFWDQERKEGRYPVGDPNDPANKPAEPPKAVAEPETPPSVKEAEIPVTPAPAPLAGENGPSETKPEELPFDPFRYPPKIREMKPADPRADWRTYPITRINLFLGRTLGSLNREEMQGLIPWLEKVEKRWGSCDNDIRAHYTMIRQRIDHEKAQEQKAFDEELNLGMEIPVAR